MFLLPNTHRSRRYVIDCVHLSHVLTFLKNYVPYYIANYQYGNQFHLCKFINFTITRAHLSLSCVLSALMLTFLKSASVNLKHPDKGYRLVKSHRSWCMCVSIHRLCTVCQDEDTVRHVLLTIPLLDLEISMCICIISTVTECGFVEGTSCLSYIAITYRIVCKNGNVDSLLMLAQVRHVK